MATGKLRQVSKSRFSDDIRERARKAIEQQRLEKERGVERFPVKPKRKLKERPLEDSKSESKSAKKESTAKKPTRKKPFNDLMDIISTPARLNYRSEMAKGGSVNKPPKPMSDAELDRISPAARKMMEQKKRDVEQERKQKKMEKEVRGKKMAKGGSVSKRADGCAVKGKTKGRFV